MEMYEAQALAIETQLEADKVKKQNEELKRQVRRLQEDRKGEFKSSLSRENWSRSEGATNL